MKKLFFWLLVCSSMAKMVFAQKVGIGTTTPLFKLDVRNGSINTDSVYRISDTTVLSTPGYQNLFIGKDAGRANTTGLRNTFCGYHAGQSNTFGQGNSFFGDQCGTSNSTGRDNSFFGSIAGHYNTTGSYNSFFGRGAGQHNAGDRNSFFGFSAGSNNDNGHSNVFIGFLAGRFNQSGNSNVAVGTEALARNITGSNHVAIGDSAMLNSWYADGNTAVGAKSLRYNTFGENSTAIGYRALHSNTTGNSNTAVGYGSLFLNTTGNGNTALGYLANTSNLTGSFSTCIGYGTRVTDFNNSAAIGYNAVATASNQVRIGNSDVTSIGGVVGWSIVSDSRFKKNVQENVPGLQFIMQLKPLTYTLDIQSINAFLHKGTPASAQENETITNTLTKEPTIAANNPLIYSGFFAQDVESAAKKMNYSFSGVDAPKNENDFYGLRYAEFVVPLVKAVQEQQQMIAQLKNEIEILKTKFKN